MPNPLLELTRLQILSAIERMNGARAAIENIGKEYSIGEATFYHNESDVVNWLYSAKEFLDSAIVQAQRARDAEDSLVSKIRRGVLAKNAERGGQ